MIKARARAKSTLPPTRRKTAAGPPPSLREALKAQTKALIWLTGRLKEGGFKDKA